jgi:hypothetical protein
VRNVFRKVVLGMATCSQKWSAIDNASSCLLA